jgi:hypothetical protein
MRHFLLAAGYEGYRVNKCIIDMHIILVCVIIATKILVLNTQNQHFAIKCLLAQTILIIV